MKAELRIAVLLSGSGRTLANLLSTIESAGLSARIVAVASDREGVRGIDIGEEAGLPVRVFSKAAFAGRKQRDAAMLRWLRSHEPQVLVLAGYLSLLDLAESGGLPMLNIHPALLPLYGGRGFYGDRVHAAVLEAGDEKSGATIHLVNDRFDEGAVLARIEVPVLEGDDVRTLADRVFAAECVLYPAVLQWIAEGALRFEHAAPRSAEGAWDAPTLRADPSDEPVE